MDSAMIFTKAPLLIAAAGCSLAMSCSSVSDAMASRRDASVAGNQMMLVRESPDTVGYRRLMTKSQEIGDLKIFLAQTGLPDFLAETRSSDRQYLIFYYLDKRQAFACRTKNSRTGQVEFAGPYPMAAGELKLLKAAKSQANQPVAGV
jgi:hypothetical protein